MKRHSLEMNIKNNKIEAILFDFDGVLCSDYFYHTLASTHADLYENINRDIFKNSKPLIRAWMRGGITYKEVHKVIASNYNVEMSFLEKELIRSVKKMRLNTFLLDFAKKMRKQGVKTVIFTDNMDIFHKILVPHTKIDTYFDLIVSSAVFKKLKTDNNGELVDWVISKLKTKPNSTLVIDDGKKLGKIVKDKGCHFFLYDRDYQKSNKDFIKWFNKNFQT